MAQKSEQLSLPMEVKPLLRVRDALMVEFLVTRMDPVQALEYFAELKKKEGSGGQTKAESDGS